MGIRLRNTFIFLASGVLIAGLLLAGCVPSSPTVAPSSGHGPDTTKTDATAGGIVPTTASLQPITSRWPPGVEAVVLSTEQGLYVVGADGVRWTRPTPAPKTSTTVTVRGIPVVSGLYGLAVSSNTEFLAYIEDGDTIIVRSIADGSIAQQADVQSEGHTTLRSISPDGILAALVTVDPQLEAEMPGDEVPWTVTVVDLTTGTTTVENKLTDLVQKRIESGVRCGLTALSWLPEYKLIVGISGDPNETYLYDPVAGRLTLVPDLWDVRSPTAVGLAVGRSTARSGEWMIWNGRDGSSEPVILDPAWPIAGPRGLNADGTALVLVVAKPAEWEAAHGWQVFRRVGSEWRPAGPVAEVDWLNQPPTLLSGNGSRAWSVAYKSTGDNETVLLSHDFTTGAWEEWFRSQDMQVDWGSIYYAAIVLDD